MIGDCITLVNRNFHVVISYCVLSYGRSCSVSMNGAHYSPPWADTSIIGIAGSSGSGKTSLAVEIVSSLNLPWVVILSMVLSFYTYQFPALTNA